MEANSAVVAEARLFSRLGVVSFVGLAFYYAHLFLGFLNTAFVFKALAVIFFLVTVPLPIIALSNKSLFRTLSEQGRRLMAFGTMLLLSHHFLMTFVFVLFLNEDRAF